MSQYYDVSWKEYVEAVEKLSNKIKRSKKKYKYIYGVPRGGLIVSVMLSHLLGIPVLLDRKRGGNVLVVDDLVDTGKTIQNYVGCDSAVVFLKSKPPEMPNFFGKQIKTSLWIRFPYETTKSTKSG